MTSAGASAQSFINYESGPVNPIRISDDGSRLYIADTLGGRLSVFDLSNPDQPFLRAEIPVGMDPVSVHPRTLNEVWVANLLSDSISIVDVSAGRVVDTLRVVDEPSDVVFAGGKAFVTAATRDEVHVFNAITRAPLTVIDIFGKDPRALAVSPDGRWIAGGSWHGQGIRVWDAKRGGCRGMGGGVGWVRVSLKKSSVES